MGHHHAVKALGIDPWGIGTGPMTVHQCAGTPVAVGRQLGDPYIADPLTAALRGYGYAACTKSFDEADDLENCQDPINLLIYSWPFTEEMANGKVTQFRQTRPNLKIIFLYPVVAPDERGGHLLYPQDATAGYVEPGRWTFEMRAADERFLKNPETPNVRVAAWSYFFRNLDVVDTRMTTAINHARSTFGDDMLPL